MIADKATVLTWENFLFFLCLLLSLNWPNVSNIFKWLLKIKCTNVRSNHKKKILNIILGWLSSKWIIKNSQKRRLTEQKSMSSNRNIHVLKKNVNIFVTAFLSPDFWKKKYWNLKKKKKNCNEKCFQIYLLELTIDCRCLFMGKKSDIYNMDGVRS